MKITNIEWGVDNIDFLDSLPTELEIPDELETIEEIEDYISNITDYYCKGFNIEHIKNLKL